MTKPYDILLDSDVVRHYLKGGQILLLPKLYPERLVMLDKVKSELCRSKSLQSPVENFLMFCKIAVVPLPDDDAIIKEYARLRRANFGEGESACMSFAKHSPHIIASSNLKDIKKYCETNGIQYLTTMDILCQAHDANMLSTAECDLFIYEVLRQGSVLPCQTLQEYITKFKKK